MPKTENDRGNRAQEVSIDDVRSDVAALKSDVGELVRALTDRGKGAAQDKLHESAERISKAYETGKERAGDAHDELGRFVSERPITSLAVAVGVGALLGRLLKN